MRRHPITARELARILTALRQTAAGVDAIAADHGRKPITVRRIAYVNDISLRGRA